MDDLKPTQDAFFMQGIREVFIRQSGNKFNAKRPRRQMNDLKPIEDAFLMQAMIGIIGLEKTKEIIIYRQALEKEMEEMISQKEKHVRYKKTRKKD